MQLDERQTLIIAILVLYLGKYLTSKIGFLREYNIPEPVSGGLIASIVVGALYLIGDVTIEFALGPRDSLLIVFFTGIGLTSKISTLVQGGKPLLILLGLAVVYLFVQNFTGVGVALLTGLPPQVGVVGGSVSLSGGHGTAIAWAPRFISDYGLGNAMEIGIASATFGLILGGIAGGPIARFLLKRYRVEPSGEGDLSVGKPRSGKVAPIAYQGMLNSIFLLCVSIGIGLSLNSALAGVGVQLPTFVTCLFAGILVINLGPVIFRRLDWPEESRSLALISELSLGFFLAMSLMSLQLWTLAGLGGPMLIMLVAQVLVISAFVIFVVFRLMGRDYDAAVISAGYVGLALGVANMTAVTEKFGASAKAFIVVPLVGAFFIDIANAVIIQTVLNWLA